MCSSFSRQSPDNSKATSRQGRFCWFLVLRRPWQKDLERTADVPRRHEQIICHWSATVAADQATNKTHHLTTRPPVSSSTTRQALTQWCSYELLKIGKNEACGGGFLTPNQRRAEATRGKSVKRSRHAEAKSKYESKSARAARHSRHFPKGADS